MCVLEREREGGRGVKWENFVWEKCTIFKKEGLNTEGVYVRLGYECVSTERAQ